MRYLLPLFCLIVACSGSAGEKKAADPKDCEKIKNGRFKVMTPPGGQNWTIFRKDSIQEEIHDPTSKTVVYSVKWNSPCEYELHYLRTQPEDDPHIEEYRRKTVLTVSVSNVNDNFYDYTMRAKGIDSLLGEGHIRIMKEDQ